MNLVKVKRFNKMFTCVLALFFLLRIANKHIAFARDKQKIVHVGYKLRKCSAVPFPLK